MFERGHGFNFIERFDLKFFQSALVYLSNTTDLGFDVVRLD